MARIFSYREALASFPRVRELTHAAVDQIEALRSRIQSPTEAEDRQEDLENAIQEIVRLWADQVSSLGCEVKGLWLVDWDSGDGYYCWRYPEETIAHFHSYDEGFAGRIPVN